MPPVNNQSNPTPSGSTNGHGEQNKLPFDDFPHSRKYSLAVQEAYTDWGPREAFRELLQNCFDAVIKTNKVRRKDLFVTREAIGEENGEATPPTGSTEIVYKVYCRNDPKCLAYIRYKGHNGHGSVEITNLGASLEWKHFYIGGTSKKNIDNQAGKHLQDQAGAHGEGLTLAALVFLRTGRNHAVFCQTTGCRLFFNFDKDGMLCFWARRVSKPETAVRPNDSIPIPAVNANGDVQFIIGDSAKGRDEHNEKVDRSPISQRDFKNWTRVALPLTVEDGDASIISTSYGSLLTSEEFRGSLYLKGLLLALGSTTHHPLGFGYDIAKGKTHRDRQSLANPSEESRAICGILSNAMLARPHLVGKVCDLLNSAEPQYAESQCSAWLWRRDIAILFKQYLLGGEFANRWLYSSTEVNPSLFQIIQGMGRQPFQLTDKLWNILVQYDLVNTVEQEAERAYAEAGEAKFPDTSFAKSVKRLLSACIRACPQTTGIRVQFVHPTKQTHLDLYVWREDLLARVHERWLALDKAAVELGLDKDVEEAEVVAFTVKRLFADVLAHLPTEAFLEQGSPRTAEWYMKQECTRAERRLAKYQQVEVRLYDKEDDGRPGLHLDWKVNALQHDDGSMIEIQLHRVSTCSHLYDDLLLATDANVSNMACISQNVHSSCAPEVLVSPSCRVHRTNLHHGSHCESGLLAGEEYFFVLVTPAKPESFVVRSNRKSVVAWSSIRHNPSVSESSPSPVAAQADVHSNASASAPGGTPPRRGFLSPMQLSDGYEEPERVSGQDDMVSESEPFPVVEEAVAPSPLHDVAQGSGAAAHALNQSGQNIADGSFSLGSRLEPRHEELLNLSFDRFEWYSAENPNNELTYVGIAKSKDGLGEESRKRRRIE